MWRYIASLIFSLLFVPSALAATQKNVLILHEGSRLLPYQFLLSNEIQMDLASTQFDIQVFDEYLDSWRLNQDLKYAGSALEAKYVGLKFDLVVVDGNTPFQLLLNRPPAFLRGTPIVFLTVPDYDVPSHLPPNVTGITVHKEYSATVRLAASLQPGLQHIFFVQSGLDSNALRDTAVRNELASFRDQLDIVDLQDLAVDDLLKRVKSLPPHSAILFDTYLKDPSGKPYIPAEVCNLIATSANAPVYGLYQTVIGRGAVGGVVINVETVAKQGAQIVLGLLAGAPSSQYPVRYSQNKILIDWSGLQRFELPESRLPSSAVILNRPPTVWESYKRYVIGGISLIAFEALLIGGLLWQRARRRKVETDLAVTNDRLRLAVEAIGESEQRFRLVANTAPVMVWMSGTDKLCNYFNKTWLEFSGRPLEAELGNGWAEGVHPEDLKACLDIYIGAFDRRESFSMQYRLRRYDGEYRWILDTGVPRSNPDGSFEGYIGSCIDVTDRKLAEEALARMGRRLIEAHEEERTWIARELHDDVLQRMALLMVELELWDQQLPDSAVDFHERTRHGLQRLSDIVDDIQALSHRLHSSKLEYLGIVAAAKSFCQELTDQQKVEIDFSHTNIPSSVPSEFSL